MIYKDLSVPMALCKTLNCYLFLKAANTTKHPLLLHSPRWCYCKHWANHLDRTNCYHHRRKLNTLCPCIFFHYRWWLWPFQENQYQSENTMQKRNYVDLVGYETQFCWKDFLFKVYCLLSSDKKWRYNYDPLHLTDAAILPCVQQIMSKILQKNYKALSI